MDGVCVKFDKKKGFGFIRVDHQEDDFFVHISDIADKQSLVAGQPVQFDVETTPKGQRAVNVQPGAVPVSPFKFFLTVGLIVTFFITILSKYYTPINWFLSYFISVNITTALFNSYDKLAAKQCWFRVPENILHLFALIGGTPFALLTQWLLRHKTIKSSFRFYFILIMVLQVLLVILWIYWRYMQ